jgi:beta-lactam-binding protein with PASTA domain
MRRGSDAKAVSGRVFTLPRLTVVGIAVLLVSATISLAADKPTTTKPASHPVTQKVLTVPDVRGQMFVFASGTLEDGGFGWKVSGGVGGFPSNLVASQSPKPGTHVVDTGAPAVTLHLLRHGAQLGEAQNRSPYGASVIRRSGAHGRS